jgi:hypothetical protein
MWRSERNGKTFSGLELRQQTTLTGAGVNKAQSLNDEEEQAMAIILRSLGKVTR